jgi:hypothetical protein
MSRKFGLTIGSVMLTSALLYGSGCNRNPEPSQAASLGGGEEATNVSLTSDEEHAHEPGAHGGIIVPLGRDNYHVEAVFEKGGLLRLYTLGRDETRVQEVEKQTPKAYVKVEGAMESTSVLLEPEPQDGDSEGKTSQFVATLPKAFEGVPLVVTIPSLRIGGERFRLGFTSATIDHGGDMPQGVSADEERKLYLTPGGIYTEADIKANGNMTVSQKFKGFKPKHDLNPKPGDKICPITLTKANPECAWIVGGKKYEFCCPPCVDEFVKLAKENPNKVLGPEEYVKKSPPHGELK